MMKRLVLATLMTMEGWAACSEEKDKSDLHEECCKCLVEKKLMEYGEDEQSCREVVAVNDENMPRVTSKCLVFDNCGTACSFWVKPNTCGSAHTCCQCLAGKTWTNSGADAGPCMESSAAACEVRVSAGEQIPLTSTYQEIQDQCLIDACRNGCKGYPPSP